jgi:hypothetical protein
MAFMQRQIEQGDAYGIDTPNGLHIIPADIARVGKGQSWRDVFAMYIEGDIAEAYGIEYRQDVWMYRLSAPGYLDCTEWGWADTEEEAEQKLSDLYGDDDEEDEEE